MGVLELCSQVVRRNYSLILHKPKGGRTASETRGEKNKKREKAEPEIKSTVLNEDIGSQKVLKPEKVLTPDTCYLLHGKRHKASDTREDKSVRK